MQSKVGGEKGAVQLVGNTSEPKTKVKRQNVARFADSRSRK